MDVYEERGAFGQSFGEKAIRKAFVMKVYSILSIQLLITVAIIAICIFVEPIKQYLIDNFLAFCISSAVLSFVMMLVITCCRAVRMNVPYNYIALMILTLLLSLLCGTISVQYSTWIVLSSFGITAGSMIILTIIAALPCIDITGWGLYLCIASLVLSLVGTVLIILGIVLHMNVLFMVYAGIAALLLCLFIVFDTQMILGGRKYQLSADEYITAAVILYNDIITFYIVLLMLIGGAHGE